MDEEEEKKAKEGKSFADPPAPHSFPRHNPRRPGGREPSGLTMRRNRMTNASRTPQRAAGNITNAFFGKLSFVNRERSPP